MQGRPQSEWHDFQARPNRNLAATHWQGGVAAVCLCYAVAEFMGDLIRISAKNLGEVALPEFCPRCFWIKLRLKNRLPYQIFPGVFSTIDSYNKRIVHSWFDRYHRAPDWMAGLGPLTGYRDPPHHSKFGLVDDEHRIHLTGSPDGVFIRLDGSHLIVDYKTSRYTGNQDKLFPMYEAQLNAYALIGEHNGLAPVSGLALLYMEPVSDDAAAHDEGSHRADGFILGFTANIHPVAQDSARIGQLMARTRAIYELAESPAARPGCKNCKLLDELVSVAKS